MKKILLITSCIFFTNTFLKAQLLSSANNTKYSLPLMVINTQGNIISEDSKIVAEMSLAHYETGNFINSVPNIYSGKISIKYRGESSAMFEKKPFGIELQKGDGSNNNVSMLGLPEENDFVLHASFNDKTLLKNVLSYQLYNEMGKWAPHTRYVELILNGQYEGVYVLIEKIKQDKNRVKISKLTEKDSISHGITGGYILRCDKNTDISDDEILTTSFGNNPYQFYDPEIKNLTTVQSDYIGNWMEEFDQSLYFDGLTGVKYKIDEESFVNILILNEFSKNVDAYRYSSYFYKENDLKGGRLVAGPPWDYDISFGNLNYGFEENIPSVEYWMYNGWSRTFWWPKMLEDEGFTNHVYCNWDRFRKGVLSNNHIFGVIDSCVNYLGSAIDRNFDRFPILGEFVWPNATYPDTYEEEITILKDWIEKRLNWMDLQWSGLCISSSTPMAFSQDLDAKVYPNPSNFSNLQVLVISKDNISKLKIELLDISGKIVSSIENQDRIQGQKVYQFNDLHYLTKGIYMIRIKNDSRVLLTKKAIKN